MTKNRYSTSFIYLAVIILMILGGAIPYIAKAQPVLGARNTALGGGGTAYLTGYEATFWNPANLMVHDRSGQWHIGLGHAGILHESVLSTEAADNQYYNFTDAYYPFQLSAVTITDRQRETILDNNYPSDRLTSQYQTRADVILGGALWQREKEAFSIVARARFASRIVVGRGWYSDKFIESEGEQVRDFTLEQHRNHLYEISFGYAREFTFFNGLSPQINKIHIGIAPKLVLAGPGMNMKYDARYIRPEDGSIPSFVSSFFYQSTGNYSNATQAYRNGSSALASINRNFDRQLVIENTGYGVGVDFGLTYIIPLGNDFSTINASGKESVTSKSIRIALSLNDVGIIRHRNNPVQLETPKDTVSASQQAIANSMFIGSNGQYLSYFEQATDLSNPILNSKENNQQEFNTLLPTSINAGIMIEYSRLTLMGDLTLGLKNNAFTNTKLAVHLGLEAYPLKRVPLRVGTRLASGLPTQVGLGTGIELRNWSFNVGTQVLIRARTLTSEFIGGAFAGLKFHF
ncbi:DUF5723 family protein [Fodinibius halophilus]|uniref:DUF5723 domain-containing protein n=1 Tax=Fodinibius halophilus TaxID=1736908 RepID=A0A6M1SZ27_9BACT|nr:DUF5723 family protein [Fodinibius halophilus]NGP86917.1 hypothetical protein [Fodinibius halophilus]